MKKAISLILSIIMLLSIIMGLNFSVSAQSNPVIYSKITSATAGSTIRVPVSIKNNTGMMNKKLIDKADAQECQMLAIDVNGDGYVDNKDAAMVARYLVGKDAF